MIESTTHESPLLAAAEARAATPALVSSMETVARSRLLIVGMDALLAEVAALLSVSQISLVVVCDASGSVVGVVTETVLVRQLGYGRVDFLNTRAGDVMNRDFTACEASEYLPEVLGMMHTRGLIHVLIVEAGNRPVGVLNARDGLRALLVAGNYEEALLRNYVMGVGYQ